jgi:hypothetical protein
MPSEAGSLTLQPCLRPSKRLHCTDWQFREVSEVLRLRRDIGSRHLGKCLREGETFRKRSKRNETKKLQELSAAVVV